MANEILGSLSSVTCHVEGTWGTRPGSPAYFYLPVENFGIKTNNQLRSNQPYMGGRFVKHRQAFNGYPSGSIGGPLCGWYDSDLSTSLAEEIFKMAYAAVSGNESRSWGIDWAQGPDTANKSFRGMRCDQFTVTGSAQSGRVEWSMNMVGKDEATLSTAQSVPNDLEKLLDFAFPDMTLSIESSAIKISQFTLTRSLNQKVKFLNGYAPNCIKVGNIVDTLTVQFLKNASTYDAVVRAMASAGTMSTYDVDIVLLGNHNGTGTNTNTRLALDLPRCSLDDANDVISPDDVFEQGLTFQVLKPDSSTAAVTATWDTV